MRSILATLLGLVVRAWIATLRLRLVTHPSLAIASDRPWVLAFWHGHQLMLLRWPRRRPLVALVSRSRDGDLAARALAICGVASARGSSSRGGAGGLKDIIRRVRRGFDAAFAVDGPRGPARVVQTEGASRAAALGRAIVVPMAAAARTRVVLARSWDRFEIPLPFSRVCVVLGAPIEPASATPPILGAAIDEARGEAERLTSPGAGTRTGMDLRVDSH